MTSIRMTRWSKLFLAVAAATVALAGSATMDDYKGSAGGRPKDTPATGDTTRITTDGTASRASASGESLQAAPVDGVVVPYRSAASGTESPKAKSADPSAMPSVLIDGGSSTFQANAVGADASKKGSAADALPSAIGPHADLKASDSKAPEQAKTLDGAGALPSVTAPQGATSSLELR
jgi:hypothetical protein